MVSWWTGRRLVAWAMLLTNVVELAERVAADWTPTPTCSTPIWTPSRAQWTPQTRKTSPALVGVVFYQWS
jgi:hypothetical protein